MELITGEQRDELITTFVERDAFHLELKDLYTTAIEDGPFAKWLKGEDDDFRWLQPWQARIRNATQAGKTVRRVRVISEPITDYIRWEHSNTVLNLEVGEDIRWLPRHLLPGGIVFPADGNDWWLFDDRLVVVGHSMMTTACRATRSSPIALSLPIASESVTSFGPSPSPTANMSRFELSGVQSNPASTRSFRRSPA